MNAVETFFRQFLEAERQAKDAQGLPDWKKFNRLLGEIEKFATSEIAGSLGMIPAEGAPDESVPSEYDPVDARRFYRLDKHAHSDSGEIWSAIVSDCEQEMFQYDGYAERFLIRPSGDSWEIFASFFWEELEDGSGRWHHHAGEEIKIADLGPSLEVHRFDEPIDDEASQERWQSDRP